MSAKRPPVVAKQALLRDVRGLIEQARSAVAATVNAGLTMLYWQIGERINAEILKGVRAEYGERIIATLSQELSNEYGQGFNYSALTRMSRFAVTFPNFKIVATLSQQLSWSHFKQLLPLEKPLQRDFYAEMCRVERWSVRALRKKIDSMLYERTALSKKPEQLIRHELRALRKDDKLTPDLVFRDPYFLDFLGLKDRYLERDLEDAILRDLEQFILELGAGFSFIARQKRIQVDSDDYYIDLLFYPARCDRGKHDAEGVSGSVCREISGSSYKISWLRATPIAVRSEWAHKALVNCGEWLRRGLVEDNAAQPTFDNMRLPQETAST